MSPRARLSKMKMQHSPASGAQETEALEARSADAMALAATIDKAMQKGEQPFLSEKALHALVTVLCRAYAAQAETEEDLRPLPQGSGVSATEVMLMTRGLLQATGLTSFEYAFWQSWAGN